MEAYFKFEELKVYQKGLLFVDDVYSATKGFPKEEIYALTSQFKRAAHSIVLNIAEGSAGTKKEFIQFLRIASRSIRECVVCIELAKRQAYISEHQIGKLRNQLSEISRMLSGLIDSLKQEPVST